MDVRLSVEQQALRDSAVNVVDRLGPSSVRDLDDGERRAKLDAAVAASGWRELRTATDTGEPWSSGVETAIVAEELSHGLADASFLGPTLAAELRRLAGSPAATANETVALSADLGSVANGAVAIDAAGAANAIVVLDGGRLATCALSEPAPVAVDLTRPSTGVDTSEATTLDGRSLHDDDLARWTALGLALTSAELVGTMRGAVQLARDYAIERRQYGSAIGSFQAVQHLLADGVRRDGGIAQRGTARGMGGRRADRRTRHSPRLPWPRPTARERRGRCARQRSRCTAASATRGNASRTCTCVAPCSRVTCSAASDRT